MKDIHYTPENLSTRLIKYIDRINIKTIVDFCVGNGSLLIAAKDRWAKANFFGADISKEAISYLKTNYPDWSLSQFDFTNKKSRTNSKIIRLNKTGFDLILLNPPFSCRGGEVHRVILNNEEFLVSTSMMFLVESIQYLAKDGVLLAILPISAAYSQKDKKIWNKLMKYHNLKILEEPKVNEFKSCSASVILVSVNTSTNKTFFNTEKSLKTVYNDVSIFRGKIGMHTLNGAIDTGTYLVHSTNIRENSLINLNYKTKSNISELAGPAVLLPRVGLPNPQKICTIHSKEKYVLSDCILAIKTKSYEQANQIKKDLLNNWNDFSNLYKGTGAKYVTIERLKIYLNIKEFKIPSMQSTFTKYTMPKLNPNFDKEPFNIPHEEMTLSKPHRQKFAIK